jgi:hypothetical protein
VIRGTRTATSFLGVPDLARLVNVFGGQSDLGGDGDFILFRNNVGPLALLADLATLLRRVVFVGQTALC